MKQHPKQTILGTVPSKSNSYRIAGAALIKTPAMTAYERSFFIQCGAYRDAGIEGYFELHVDAHYPNQRSDLDGCLKAVLDCLQKVGAIKNDNRCVKIVARKFLDKANPRIEFHLTEI